MYKVMYNALRTKESSEMDQMIRKQIYLGKRQELLLKRLSKARGISEAELIRQALDRELNQGAARRQARDPRAWARARRVMLTLQAQGPLPARPRRWKRDDLYEERLNRHGTPSH